MAVIARGTTAQLTATGVYSDGSSQDLTTQVTWTTSDPQVATVSNGGGSRGLVSATGAGTATVTAALGGVTGSTAVNVTAVVLKSVAVTPTDPSVTKGGTVAFSATGTYSDGSTQDLTAGATWTSSDGAVASVSNAAGSQGTATALATGTATISAAVGGVSGSSRLTVTAATLQSIALAQADQTIAAGTKAQLKATGTYSEGSTQDLNAAATR